MVDVKLLTLLKVYELGNYTRAAEKLSLTQPAVSQHIKQIERELNTVIFDRTGGKIRPTPEGRLVIQYAERVVSLYENLQRSLEDRQRSIDRLRVGITHTSESNLVTEVLARYSAQSDNVKITIQTDTINNLYEMLKTYKIDIAIVEGAVPDPSIEFHHAGHRLSGAGRVQRPPAGEEEHGHHRRAEEGENDPAPAQLRHAQSLRRPSGEPQHVAG